MFDRYFSYKTNSTTYIIYVVLLVLSFVDTLFVATNTPAEGGTNYYFTLPLTFGLCLIFFKRIIPYHSGGYALKVFYFFCVVRYLFLPYHTCSFGSFATHWSSAAYSYAIFMQEIELIVSCCVIDFYYRRKFIEISTLLSNKKSSFYEELTLGGFLVIVFALMLIMSRGFDELLSYFRFFIVTDSIEVMWGYDQWMVHTMMPFLIIIITSYFQKRNTKHDNVLNAIIPSLLCLLSCTMIFGNNRMMLVYFALSGLSVLSVSFKKYSNIISVIILASFVVVIFTFTMVKQYNTDVSQRVYEQVDEDLTSKYLSEYVSSTEAIAKVYDMYSRTGNQMEVATIFADIVDKTHIFHLPNMPMKKWVEGITPSYTLAMTGSEIVPMAGQTLYYGGYVLGWLLDILVFWLVIYLMVIFEIHSKLEVNLGNRYIYTWMSIICAMAMCYHLGIIYAAFNYVPFFLWLALKANRSLASKRKLIITSNT